MQHRNSGRRVLFSTHCWVSHGRAAPGRRTSLGGDLDRSCAATERSSKTPSRSRFQSLGPARPLTDSRTRSGTFNETAIVSDHRPTSGANSETQHQISGRQVLFRPTGGSVTVERLQGSRADIGGGLGRCFAAKERSSKTPSKSRFESSGPARPLTDSRTRSGMFIETALVPDHRPTIEANSEAHLQNSGRQAIFRPTGGSVAVERPRAAEPTLAAAWAVVWPAEERSRKTPSRSRVQSSDAARPLTAYRPGAGRSSRPPWYPTIAPLLGQTPRRTVKMRGVEPFFDPLVGRRHWRRG